MPKIANVAAQNAVLTANNDQLRAELALRALKDARQRSDGCIVYRGGTDSNGFGRFRYEGKLYSPHRVVLEQLIGRPLAKGEDAKQVCKRRNCINPAHLFVGLRKVPKGPRIRMRVRKFGEAVQQSGRPLLVPSLEELVSQLDGILLALRAAAAVAAKERRVVRATRARERPVAIASPTAKPKRAIIPKRRVRK